MYSGQLDISIASPLVESMINNFKWNGSGNYSKSKKYIWKVDRKIAGYFKKAKPLYFMIIQNAGHILAFDFPKIALEMITQFIKDELEICDG